MNAIIIGLYKILERQYEVLIAAVKVMVVKEEDMHAPQYYVHDCNADDNKYFILIL